MQNLWLRTYQVATRSKKPQQRHTWASSHFHNVYLIPQCLITVQKCSVKCPGFKGSAILSCYDFGILNGGVTFCRLFQLPPGHLATYHCPRPRVLKVVMHGSTQCHCQKWCGHLGSYVPGAKQYLNTFKIWAWIPADPLSLSLCYSLLASPSQCLLLVTDKRCVFGKELTYSRIADGQQGWQRLCCFGRSKRCHQWD